MPRLARLEHGHWRRTGEGCAQLGKITDGGDDAQALATAGEREMGTGGGGGDGGDPGDKTPRILRQALAQVNGTAVEQRISQAEVQDIATATQMLGNGWAAAAS